MKARKIAVIGLGYVGLQVAVAFGKKQKVVAFDINKSRLEDLSNNFDKTGEVSKNDLINSNLFYTSTLEDLKEADLYIIAVPTPINNSNEPDLNLLIKASETVSKVLKKGDIAVYESTVYPGTTEEVCMPILQKGSGLECNKDFFLGYSPERINPGDKIHTFEKIKKIVSASDNRTLKILSKTYSSVVKGGIYEAVDIKTAEAAKIIENTQRDVNIALINELAMLFKKMDIETSEVLEAASTKWNFLNFQPGLVGGHCVGVDPYYLTYKAKKLGFNPEVILSGRKVNDSMPKFISKEIIKILKNKKIKLKGAKINFLGITFKENCSDIRNSKALEIYDYLKPKVKSISVVDSHAIAKDVKKEIGIELINLDSLTPADVTIIATSHNEFASISANVLKKLTRKSGFTIDIKNILPKEVSEGPFEVWKL